ncbi:DUF4174 domain-containing protein [Maribacter sp. ACAM166]|uniref:DUF4174 domain-containing protein n=1 Tax=Maribacter sp. ACAM166 TaxID=2508996 RepID=UPI0014859D5B|nr:DUF4174 domain-containing protein [Maribacter sp. ACAM166]
MIQGTSLTAQKLSDYTWKNRVLILSENNSDSFHTKTALKIIEGSAKELNERAIIIFLFKENKLYDLDEKEVEFEKSNILPKYFNGYLLIGKDGGVKTKHPYPLDLEGIYNLIDGMPMRRAEMKSNN